MCTFVKATKKTTKAPKRFISMNLSNKHFSSKTTIGAALGIIFIATSINQLSAQIAPMPMNYGAERFAEGEAWFRRDVQQEAQKRLRMVLRTFPESPASDHAALLLADAQFRAGAQNPDEYVSAQHRRL